MYLLLEASCRPMLLSAAECLGSTIEHINTAYSPKLKLCIFSFGRSAKSSSPRRGVEPHTFRSEGKHAGRYTTVATAADHSSMFLTPHFWALRTFDVTVPRIGRKKKTRPQTEVKVEYNLGFGVIYHHWRWYHHLPPNFEMLTRWQIGCSWKFLETNKIKVHHRLRKESQAKKADNSPARGPQASKFSTSWQVIKSTNWLQAGNLSETHQIVCMPPSWKFTTS